MKRFLLVLALVGVAGATYVATAPGSQTAGPTAKQFRALKREVAGLKKQVSQVKVLALEEAVLLTDCMAVAKPVAQFGTDGTTTGYEYTDNGGTPFPRSALNYAQPTDPNVTYFTGGGSQCATDVSTSIRHLARLAGIRLHQP